jgi:hypothetical protein
MNPGSLPKLNASSTTSSIESTPFSHATALSSFFDTIPPERVGLNGEYDHNGLAKRVSLAFGQEFQPTDIANLRVRQRGGVLIFTGRVLTQRLLTQLIQTALQVPGAIDVEVCGVTVESNRELVHQHDYLNPRLYAC